MKLFGSDGSGSSSNASAARTENVLRHTGCQNESWEFDQGMWDVAAGRGKRKPLEYILYSGKAKDSPGSSEDIRQLSYLTTTTSGLTAWLLMETKEVILMICMTRVTRNCKQAGFSPLIIGVYLDLRTAVRNNKRFGSHQIWRQKDSLPEVQCLDTFRDPFETRERPCRL